MKTKKRKPPALRPGGVDRLDNEALRETLLDKLTVDELKFAVMMRVMRDRFGFGKKRLRRLWDACLEYIHDIDEGLLNTEEMLKCLEHEDHIKISWRVEV